MRSAILLVLAGLMGGRLAAQANTRWEYGTLTLINIGTMVPVWSAGDTTAVLEWPREKDVIGADTKPRTIPQASSQLPALVAEGVQHANLGRGLGDRPGLRVRPDHVFLPRPIEDGGGIPGAP